MKKLLLFTLISVISLSTLFSQSCLPEGITFTTQEQIDNFQAENPGCTEIEGDVNIGGSDISNLDSLISITSIGGSLSIGYYYMRPDDGWITVGNPNLICIQGLQNLISIGGSLHLYGNLSLTELSGMDNLQSVGGWIVMGTLLTSGWGAFPFGNAIEDITALSNLESIDGGISIEFNNLYSLEGLDNIDPNTITVLRIAWNSNLSQCEIQSICDYIEATNSTYIGGNAPGCNSQEEVEEACETVSIEENSKTNLTIRPNPFTTSTTIEYQLNTPQTITISFFNQLGKEVDRIEQKQAAGQQQVMWTPDLPGGVYYFRLEAGEQQASGKVVLVR